MIAKAFGLVLKEQREAIEMTQEEMSKSLGFKDGTPICKLELGLRDIYLGEAVSIADLLNIHFMDLMDLVDEKRKELTKKK